jgi:hypothetical protein
MGGYTGYTHTVDVLDHLVHESGEDRNARLTSFVAGSASVSILISQRIYPGYNLLRWDRTVNLP